MLNLISSAIKAKAPIVAIPVEGHAPVCLNRKRLATWAKGVTILSVKVTQRPAEWYAEEKNPGYSVVGPRDLVAVEVTYPRMLVIEGCAGNVKTRATFVPIDRRVAVKELSVWSEKERARRTKKILLGALSPEQKKIAKRALISPEWLSCDLSGEITATVAVSVRP